MVESEGLYKQRPDQIRVAPNGNLQGFVYFFDGEVSPSKLTKEEFDIIPGRTLTPFCYMVPEIDAADPLNMPKAFNLDTSKRKGHVPLAIVRNVLRAPDHLFEPDDGIITAFKEKIGGYTFWRLRYYPKASIATEVMDEAHQILRGTRPHGLKG